MVTTAQECHPSSQGCSPHTMSITATQQEPGWNSPGYTVIPAENVPSLSSDGIGTPHRWFHLKWLTTCWGAPGVHYQLCVLHTASDPHSLLTDGLLMAPSCAGRWSGFSKCSCINSSLMWRVDIEQLRVKINQYLHPWTYSTQSPRRNAAIVLLCKPRIRQELYWTYLKTLRFTTWLGLGSKATWLWFGKNMLWLKISSRERWLYPGWKHSDVSGVKHAFQATMTEEKAVMSW